MSTSSSASQSNVEGRVELVASTYAISRARRSFKLTTQHHRTSPQQLSVSTLSASSSASTSLSFKHDATQSNLPLSSPNISAKNDETADTVTLCQPITHHAKLSLTTRLATPSLATLEMTLSTAASTSSQHHHQQQQHQYHHHHQQHQQDTNDTIIADTNDVSVVITRELDNDFDYHALAVHLDDRRIGYIPSCLSSVLSPLIDTSNILIVNDAKLRVISSTATAHAATRIALTVYVESTLHDNLIQRAQMSIESPSSIIAKHFTTSLLDASARHDHLLIDDERQAVVRFDTLSTHAQNVYIKLLARKLQWHKLSTINVNNDNNNTSEVIKRDDIIDELQNANFLTTTWSSKNKLIDKESRLSRLSSLLACCTGDETRHLCAAFKIKRSGSLHELRQRLHSLLFRQKRLDGNVAASSIAVHAVFARVMQQRVHLVEGERKTLLRLYGLQTLSIIGYDTDKVDLGVRARLVYVPYKLSSRSGPFFTRDSFLAYEHAVVLSDRAEYLEEHGEWSEISTTILESARKQISVVDTDMTLPSSWRIFRASTLLGRVLQRILNAYEKLRQYKQAVKHVLWMLDDLPALAGTRRRGLWWVRLILDVDVHIGDKGMALSLCERALHDPSLTPASVLSLRERYQKLIHTVKNIASSDIQVMTYLPLYEVLEIEGRPTNRIVGQKSRFFGYDDSQCSVEELVLQHMHIEFDFEGEHDEGSIFCMLLTLLLWDVVWMPADNVFLSPYQNAPLDWGSSSFYNTRKKAIEVILTRIARGDGASIIEYVYALHAGQQCAGVNWQRYNKTVLLDVLSCMDLDALVSFARMKCQGLCGGGGFPDLCLWRIGNNEGEVRRESELVFAEVKGPRDRLFEKQQVFLQTLHKAGFRTMVVKVKEPQIVSKKDERERVMK